ncbi:tRNA (guanine(10)-N(2))-methyltransferase TRMT11 [Ciona intestinalis]
MSKGQCLDGFKCKYLILLAQDKLLAHISELESVAQTFGFKLNIKQKAKISQSTGKTDFTKWIILQEIAEENVLKLMSRSVCAMSAFELWGSGSDFSSLKQSILEYPLEQKGDCFKESQSFAIRIKGIGKKMSSEIQRERIDLLEDVLPFQGKVDLVNPSGEFYLVEDYTNRVQGLPPKEPDAILFGRLLCNGQRSLIERYSLKKRKFIGNTSMDVMLSILMTNLGGINKNSVVCDPFVGTGSLLIPAAHFGGYVIGGDINYNIINARGRSSRKGAGWRQKDETIRHTLMEYGLRSQYLDVLLCDAACHAWNTNGKELFDAIITDPPYGIREACQKVGSKKQNPVVPELEPGLSHFPEQTEYHLEDVFKDLLNFAAQSLVAGGRLVYWLPVFRADYSPKVIPTHSLLKLMYNHEQILNSHSSRRLIVMEKLAKENVTETAQATISSSVFSGHNSFRDKYFSAHNGHESR